MMSKKYLLVFFVLSIVLAIGVISTVPASPIKYGIEICKESKRIERTSIIERYYKQSECFSYGGPYPYRGSCYNGTYTLTFPQDSWDPTKNITVNRAYLDIVGNVTSITVNGNNDSINCYGQACRAEIQPSHLNPGINELILDGDPLNLYFAVEYTYTPTQC